MVPPLPSRVARCTKRLVERVRAKTLAHPKITAGILEAMDQVRGESNIYMILDGLMIGLKSTKKLC